MISVITAAYNAADILGRAIDSVLSQTYFDFESVVVDDGSTDGTFFRVVFDGMKGPPHFSKQGDWPIWTFEANDIATAGAALAKAIAWSESSILNASFSESRPKHPLTGLIWMAPADGKSKVTTGPG